MTNNNVTFEIEDGVLVKANIDKGIESITIPDSVTSIGKNAFARCTFLENITIPDSVTRIGNWAFKWCDSIENITIPDSVTNIGNWAFNFCFALKTVTIPDSINNIKYLIDKYRILETTTLPKTYNVVRR